MLSQEVNFVAGLSSAGKSLNTMPKLCCERRIHADEEGGEWASDEGRRLGGELDSKVTSHLCCLATVSLERKKS